MCIVIAKYFPKYGWVGIKNRDRNYTPSMDTMHYTHNDLTIDLYVDKITGYTEGFNSNGTAILSASLMVRDDEKEASKSKHPSKDGKRIKNALELSNIKDSIESLIEQQLTGNTIIFNSKECYILEAARNLVDNKKEFIYRIHEVKPTQYVARTNHGVELPWAGYQRHVNKANTLSRISSEARLLLAEFITDISTTPKQIVDLLQEDYTNHPQLNPVRTSYNNKKMQTTSQIIIVPKLHMMYIKPIQCKITSNNKHIKII